MIRGLIFTFIILVGARIAFTQNPNLGTPFIYTYPKDVYRSGAQNWDMAQDSRGVMYYANNNGLLFFDGSVWKTFPLPNATIVRSVAISEKGEIYVGGQNEFGKFIPDNQGTLVYRSLKHLIPEMHQGFEDVWDIVVLSDTVFFRASEKLFRIVADQCKVYDQQSLVFLGRLDDRVLVQDLDTGLFYFDNDGLKKLPKTELLKGKLVSALLTRAQSSVIVTQNDGLFLISEEGIKPWKTDADDFLKQNRIISASRSKNGQFAFGTDFAGLLIMDSLGVSLFHLDRSTSLLNNKVFSAFFDKSQNLWLGVDNGINYIELNSPFTRIYPDQELEGSGYAIKIFNDRIYFGTSNGLYYTDWKAHYNPLNPLGFKLVENTKGQNWGLEILEGDLLLGHNKGAFQIKGEKANNFYDKVGVWNFKRLEKNKPYIIAGTYKNFSLLKKDDGIWTHHKDFSNWSESSRFLEQDEQGNIWMAHPYKGVYKIRFENEFEKLEVKKYGANSGLPSDIQNHLFKINGQVVFCGARGIYGYNAEKDLFEPDDKYNAIFGLGTKIRRLTEAPNGDIWFITKDEIGVLGIMDRGLEKTIRKQVFPQFASQLNPGFEAIYPYDEKNVFITDDKGFIHYNPSFDNQPDSSFEVVLNEIRLTTHSDSILFGGFYSDSLTVPKLNAADNALQITFSATDYIGSAFMEYQFYLEGSEEKWQEWSTLHTKEYTNLPSGDYTFHIKARNQNGVISPVTSYQFEIMTPWYALWIAKIAYGLIFLFLLGSVMWAYRKKYYGLKENMDLTIKASEATIGKLKEERIQAELEFKQRELASTAMHVVQKNKTLGDIKDQLELVKKMNKDAAISKEIQKMINMLQQDAVVDEGWEQFMLHFNQLHGDYYTRLKNRYPSLTPKDLKMCTYLRMNLSTKEMATLLNVTTRGIEASRYRLRKKINIDKEENLTEFLMHF